MKEIKDPLTNREELTEENLKQVTGGFGHSFSMGANASGIEAAAPSVNADTARAFPAAGPAWEMVEHVQPSKTVGRLEPAMPKPVVPSAPKPATEIDPRSM